MEFTGAKPIGIKEEYQKELDKLKESSGDAWEDLKGGVEGAWDSLSTGIKKAASRFN